MSQTEKAPLTGCLSVSPVDRPCPNPAPATVLEDASYSVSSRVQHDAITADLRSPADCYHSEAYLIGWLVKLYGWRVMEPGTLRRAWNGREAAAAAREVA